MGSFELPLLDASLFLCDDELKRREFADQFRDSLMVHGFARVVNHSVPEAMVDKLFDWSKKFFALPLDVKRQIRHKPGPYPQRGWSSVGSENTAKLFKALHRDSTDTITSDSKEHLDVGPLTDMDFPNIWLCEEHLPGFKTFMEDFYEKSYIMSRQLLNALEISLSLPTGAFMGKCLQPADELRVNHYPPNTQTKAQLDVYRAWPHTDLGVITCLFQDNVGGLEMEDRSHKGRFQGIQPGRRSEMVVNVSETLERWTNGAFTAGVHRVTLPQNSITAFTRGDEVIVPERFSIPYFVKADRNASIGPLPQFINDSTPSAYPNMTGLEFHIKRIAAAY